MKMFSLYKFSSSLIIGSLCLTLFGACESMEDTYKPYQSVTVYSPKVSNLGVKAGYKTVTLFWTNPKSDLAKSIIIAYDGIEVPIEGMVETATLNDLNIKGYEISVITIDAFGNRSVPSTVYVFPNGES